MSDPLAPLLEHWREFYLLVGTAAAALVALLFVAASIGAGYLSAERSAKTRTFMSPVVLHFTAVLFACMIGLVPSHTRGSLGVLIAAGAIGAAIYALVILTRVLKDDTIDLADRLAYGISPLIGYAAGLVAAGLFFIGSHWAPDVLAGAVVWLLTVNIRNAWDLMLFLTEKHTDSH
jgi:sugar phosphate permease